jgi:hypothetical protein
MDNANSFLAVLAALALGALVPGCSPKPKSEPDGRPTGLLCAASVGGANFCVSASEGPAAAWDKAAQGTMPIQTWAEPLPGVTIDDLVESEDRLRDWFTNIDTVLTYVRDTQKNAESYKASMEGNLGVLLKQSKDRQAELLAAKPVDALANFKQAVSDKASAEKSPIVATIADDKQSMIAVQAVFDQSKLDVAPLSSAFTAVAAQFVAYRGTEASETSTYTTLAQQASQSTLATLPDVEQAILLAGQDASAKPGELSSKVLTLSAQLQAFEVASQASISPHLDFLATHGAALPDMTSSAMRSLNAMLGYIQQRIARSDATATSLLGGTAARYQALVVLSTGPIMSAKVAQKKFLAASQAFADASTARVLLFSATPPKSAVMSLPYLARRYDVLTAFLQLAPLCDPASSSWREAGCVSLRNHFGAAATEHKTTLPTLIATGIATMSAKGVDAPLLDAAKAKLDSGDIKSAAILYDAAVRATEGT